MSADEYFDDMPDESELRAEEQIIQGAAQGKWTDIVGKQVYVKDLSDDALINAEAWTRANPGNPRSACGPNLELPLPELTFAKLRAVNVSRCESVFHPVNDWTPAEWAVAMAGECGEACNAVKKLRRIADGTNTSKDPQTEQEAKEQIAGELADLIIYADLLAARLGIDLAVAIADKFNIVSELRGAVERL